MDTVLADFSEYRVLFEMGTSVSEFGVLLLLRKLLRILDTKIEETECLEGKINVIY